MVRKKLLILGAGGLLGQTFLDKQYLLNWEVKGHFGRRIETNADLNETEQAINYLDTVQPDAVLNLIALTDVDRCEAYPNEAFLANVKVVENVSNWINAQDKKVQFVQISSDQVYDGQGPHNEATPVLKNYYAFSKYAGELAAIPANAAVLRTNFFGKSQLKHRSSFTDWLYSALTQQSPIQLFDDVLFSPLSMTQLCKIIAQVIEKDIVGTYNVGSKEGLSKADFAYNFADALGLNTENMKRVSIDDVKIVKTYRPKDMRLDVTRIEKALSMTMPSLSQEIINVAKEYN